jgi:hypothetical protein
MVNSEAPTRLQIPVFGNYAKFPETPLSGHLEIPDGPTASMSGSACFQ